MVHDGAIDGFTAHLGFVPETGQGLIILMRVAPHRAGRRVEREEPARLRADPELAATIAVQREDRHPTERSSRCAVDEGGRAGRTIEAIEPIVGRDPKSTAGIVGDSVDGMRRTICARTLSAPSVVAR